MPISLNTESNTLEVRVSGTITPSVQAQAAEAVRDAIRKHGDIQLLIVLEDFAGWSRSEDWVNAPIHFEFDVHLKRVAVVGDPKWKDDLLAFLGLPLRDVPFQYFAAERAADARAWLGGGTR